jgi:predicted alpha/beta-fold hydrolase
MDTSLYQQFPTLTPIIGTGFSMGSIVLSNHTTSLSRFNGLTSVVGLCALASAKDVYNQSAIETWEYGLVDDTKNALYKIEPQLQRLRVQGNLTEPDYNGGRLINFPHLARAGILRELDSEYSARVSNSANIDRYYDNISFAEDNRLSNLKNSSTRLYIVQTANDPVIHVDTATKAIEQLTSESNEYTNCIVEVVKYGGHIGHYQSWNDRWGSLSQYTFDIHMTQLEAIQKSNNDHKKTN